MKRLLQATLLICLMISFCLPAFGQVSKEADAENKEFSTDELSPLLLTGETGYQVITEDGDLQLLLDENGLKIAVKNQKTDAIWESTPATLQDDPTIGEDVAAAMQDLVQVTYYAGTTMSSQLGSYKDCVMKEQYQLYTTDNGLVMVLTLGEATGILINPRVLSVEVFEQQILPALEGNERAISRLNYLYERSSLSDYSEEKQKEMLQKYPTLSKQDLYIAGSFNKSAQKEFDKYFKEAGFTVEKMMAEYEALQYEADISSEPSFEIPIWFTLENGTFRVRIDTNHIKYDEEQFYIHQLALMPYFGAAEITEEGYLLFPAGSGAKIGFNADKKMSQLNVLGKVYGADMSAEEDDDIDIQCPLPIFGIKRGEKAMLAVISQGEGDAYIQVENGNIISPYATVRSLFGIGYKISQEFYGSDSGILKREKRPYLAKTLELTYHFLDEQAADLAGMAETVRKTLVDKGMTETALTDKLPLYLDTLGALDNTQKSMPWEQSVYPLTTYAQVKQILTDMKQAEIPNIQLRLIAMANGGLNYTAYSKIKPESVLGSQQELKELIASAEEYQATVYPDVPLSVVGKESMFDGFSANRDTVRTINGSITMLREFDMVLAHYKDSEKQMMINANAAIRFYDAVKNTLKDWGCQGVSLGDIGRYVNTDFGTSTRETRSDSAAKYQQLLADVAGNVTVNYGNAYALTGADHVVGIPTVGVEINGCGESVPFLQMVCFGSVEYASAAVNAQGDMTNALLKCVEFGAAPYFVVAYDNLLHLRTNSAGQVYCHVDYTALKQEITDGYHFVAKALEQVRGSRMISYQAVSDTVVAVGYANGVTIVVNYGAQPATYESTSIAAKSYQVFGAVQ